MNSYTFNAAVAAIALLAGSGSAVQAQEARTSYHPYELATIAGQRAVIARIAHAAERACADDGRVIGNRMANKACTRALTAQMVAHTGEPMLVALYGGNSVQVASNAR